MHGIHFLNEEYQISANRLSKSNQNCIENSCPNRLQPETEPLPLKVVKVRSWRVFKNSCKIIFALFVLAKGIVGSIRPFNNLKFSTATQLIASYVTPKFLMFKRSFVMGMGKAEVSKTSSRVSRIIEIVPTPLHLIIALSGLEEAKQILKRDSASQLITPYSNISTVYNSTILRKIHLNTNSTTIFESLAFSWCESFKKNKIYPTKLIIIGPAKISSCVMGGYRWALKIPKEIISFRIVNSTEISPNFTDCSQDRQDPFDCGTKGREDIRSKYSKMCPDLAPILLACNNHITLEKALAYKPKWAANNKKFI